MAVQKVNGMKYSLIKGGLATLLITCQVECSNPTNVRGFESELIGCYSRALSQEGDGYHNLSGLGKNGHLMTNRVLAREFWFSYSELRDLKGYRVAGNILTKLVAEHGISAILITPVSGADRTNMKTV
jgi:hypothetical protein